MAVTVLSEGRVRIIVITVSLLGMAALLVVGSLSDVPRIDIGEAEDYNGERVSVKGQVVGIDPMEGGAMSMLIYDLGEMLKAYVEDELDVELIGDVVLVTGEVFVSGGEPTITVQSSDSIQVEESRESSIISKDPRPGDFVWTRGVVISSSYAGSKMDILRISPIKERGSDGRPLEIRAMDCDRDTRTGDVVNITGLVSDDGSILCFGDPSIFVLSRGVPTSLSLNTLLSEMEEGSVPAVLDPVNVQGYLKYEPTNWSFYISDVPEGSSVSVKVSVTSEGLHKGDLVSLTNCSLIWEGKAMRFHLKPEGVKLLRSYGKWTIGLGDLPYGLSEFEDVLVSINGHIESINGTRYITDDTGYLELRGFEDEIASTPLNLVGRVRYDRSWNSYYLEEREEVVD